MMRRNCLNPVIIHKIKKFNPHPAVSFVLFYRINNLVGHRIDKVVEWNLYNNCFCLFIHNIAEQRNLLNTRFKLILGTIPQCCPDLNKHNKSDQV